MKIKDQSYKSFSQVIIPKETDYVGVYLTNRCFLSCPYCITNIFNPYINTNLQSELSSSDWISSINRLRLPEGVPVTLQGGEPFLHKGIWEILENIQHKADILTALPVNVNPDAFKALKTLDWNKRDAPYPTIRVSFHHGQNDYRDLINRIKELQEIVSIGLFHIEHPEYPDLTEEVREYAKKQGVEFRTKIFLGIWEGKVYGRYKYKDASSGHQIGKEVQCRNTVLPIGPEGTIYRCHSDLYADRKDLAIGCITDPDLEIKHMHRKCLSYGLCSPCDIKIKTNHLQQDGYCSVDIKF